jgi:hypothetical protein
MATGLRWQSIAIRKYLCGYKNESVWFFVALKRINVACGSVDE